MQKTDSRIHELEQSPEEALKAIGDKQALQNSLLQKAIEISLILPTQAYFLSGIRDFTLNLVENLTGFSKNWAFRFQAVVDELCNNAIEHGSKPGKNIKVTFVSEKDKSIQIIVEDTGTSEEKRSARELTDLLEKRKHLLSKQYLGFRGRGLPLIVCAWTDEIHFEDIPGGGIRVCVKKYLRREEDIVSSETHDPTHLILS